MGSSALLYLYRFFLCIRQPLGWRGRVTFKGGTSNYTLPAAGLFLLPLWVRQCTGLSARADSDEFHITIYITTKKANYDIGADFLTFRSPSLDEQFLRRGAGGEDCRYCILVNSQDFITNVVILQSSQPYTIMLSALTWKILIPPSTPKSTTLSATLYSPP